jgi:hypothetical protein
MTPLDGTTNMLYRFAHVFLIFNPLLPSQMSQLNQTSLTFSISYQFGALSRSISMLMYMMMLIIMLLIIA